MDPSAVCSALVAPVHGQLAEIYVMCLEQTSAMPMQHAFAEADRKGMDETYSFSSSPVFASGCLRLLLLTGPHEVTILLGLANRLLV